jgi:hypothetical protein
MSTSYHIYSGNTSGGPVDYTTPVATTASLSWTSGALAANTTINYAVRAFDTVSGLEEANVDARVTVRTNASQLDITGRPNVPTSLTARATAAASLQVRWQYNPGGQGGAPTGFHVYAGTPSVSYATPAATVAYVPGSVRPYQATLTSLTDGALYQVSVRAYNASGEESNTTVMSVTAKATGPKAVDSLTATVVA